MKFRLFLLTFVIILLAACSGDEPPVAATIADACQQEEFTKVTADGYLRLFTFGATICQGDECDLAFYSEPNGTGDLMTARVDADAQPGDGENAIEMPPQTYELDDLRVYTNEGTAVTQDTPLTLTGYINHEADRCFLSVTEIVAR